MKKVCFVCLGNICRSPMAEFIMKSITDDSWQIESRGTSSWEHGNPVHKGTKSILINKGYPYNPSKKSQQISLNDLDTFDMIIAMDQQNMSDLKTLSNGVYDHKIHLFCENGVPDPWYTGDFEETHRIVLEGCHYWLNQLSNKRDDDETDY